MKILPLAVLLLLAACGDPQPEKVDPPPKPGAETATGGHGKALDLGTVTIDGKKFGIVCFGDVVPGVEGAFEVHSDTVPGAELASLNLYLWVESRDGTQLSAPAKGHLEGGGLHFHVTPRKSEKVPFRAVVRLRGDGVDERAGLPLDGHGHEHNVGARGGIPATFKGGEVSGHLELKLHDDKGDLELWLGEDARIKRPFDLPLDASVEIEFVDLEGRKIALRPREATENKDEGGNAHVRDGKTNYFVFPSKDGEDPAWLKGKDFSSIVIVRFSRDGQAFESSEFVLQPHAH